MSDVMTGGNCPLSQEALAFCDRMWPCEPPCDSYGVCSNCCEKTIHHAGYNHGYRAAGAEIARLKSLLNLDTAHGKSHVKALLEIARLKAQNQELMKCVEFYADPEKWKYMDTDFGQFVGIYAEVEDGGDGEEMHHYPCPVGGKRARDVLSRIKSGGT